MTIAPQNRENTRGNKIQFQEFAEQKYLSDQLQWAIYLETC